VAPQIAKVSDRVHFHGLLRRFRTTCSVARLTDLRLVRMLLSARRPGVAEELGLHTHIATRCAQADTHYVLQHGPSGCSMTSLPTDAAASRPGGASSRGMARAPG